LSLGPDDRPPVLDLAHLERQTMGDRALRAEILSLFTAEVERLLVQVEETDDADKRVERLHAVAGLARNVGATRLAHVARGLEEDAREGGGAVRLDPLRAAVREVLDAIRSGRA
jgi:HPt (histidine-containing phosphotransfer) domain-containing protein